MSAAPLSEYTGIPGWESAKEQSLLIELASKVPANGVIVEIGVEYGMSTSLFLKASQPSVRIHSVDIMGNEMWIRWRERLRKARNDERLPLRDLPVSWEGDSAEVGQKYRESFGANIDLLFVDGDHSYNGVYRDITEWVPNMKRGSTIVFHDVACETNPHPHPLHHDVARAINSWLSTTDRWQIIRTVDSCVVVSNE